MDANLSKPLNFCIKILKVTGLWMDGTQSWLYVIYGTFLQFFVLLMFTAFIFTYMAQAKSLTDFIDALGLSMANVAQMFKTFFLVYRMKNILEMMKNLESLIVFSADGRTDSRPKIIKKVFYGMKVHKIFLCFGVFTCSTAGISGFVSHQLQYRVWFPFDTEDSEAGFIAASIYLIVGPLTVAITDLTLDMFPVAFMCYAMGLIEELVDRLSLIGKPLEIDGNMKKSLKKIEVENLEKRHQQNQIAELVKCVEIHRKIKSLVKEIGENFSKGIFAQGTLSTVILCACAFVLATETDTSRSVRMISFIVPMTLEIFLPCYFGNELNLASAELSSAIFYSDWYNGDEKLKKNVKFFMENTKKSMLISAFGLFDVNLETFKRIVNSAYSLFAVLNRVNH